MCGHLRKIVDYEGMMEFGVLGQKSTEREWTA